MNTREWFRTARPTAADLVAPSRLWIVRKKSAAGKVLFLVPEELRAHRRPRALIEALEAKYPGITAANGPTEPIGTRLVRIMRRILVRPEFSSVKAALKMDVVTN